MPAPAIRIAILAGGSGTRFWPAGRASWPKQCLALDGDDPRPLLTLTRERVEPLTPHEPWIVAPAALARPLGRLLPDLGREALVQEPAPRNTAAAVILAAHLGRQADPRAPVLVVPADHHVAPLGRYRAVLRAMTSRARRAGTILTLGLRPERPATGYGYLRVGRRTEERSAGPVHEVERFVEKPGRRTAKRLADDRRHLWNGGTFAFLPDVLLEEARRHLPDVADPLDEAFDAYGSRRFAAALRKAYAILPSISIDYGVMEKTRLAEVLAARLEWDDLGSWDAVARHRRADPDGNRVRGDATLVDARDCLVDAEPGTHVALLDVEGLVVVQTEDTVLIARRGAGERVRDVVERLRAEGREDLLS